MQYGFPSGLSMQWNDCLVFELVVTIGLAVLVVSCLLVHCEVVRIKEMACAPTYVCALLYLKYYPY